MSNILVIYLVPNCNPEGLVARLKPATNVHKRDHSSNIPQWILGLKIYMQIFSVKYTCNHHEMKEVI